MTIRPSQLSGAIESVGHVNLRLGEVLDGLPVTVRPTVGVVVAVDNAASTIAHLFARLPKVDEVVLVDLGSKDDTVRFARSLWPGLVVVDGGAMDRGNALRAGSDATTSDIVVLFDGDGPGDLAELPRLLQTLIDGADVAKGTRFADPHESGRGIGNGALLRLANAAFGTTYTDISFGYYAFWRSALDRIVLDHGGVEVDMLLALRSARAGLLVAEVPCVESPRLDGHRKNRPVLDRFRLLKAIASEFAGRDDRGLIDPDAVAT